MSKKKNYSKMYSTEEETITTPAEETPVEAEPEAVETPIEKPVTKTKAKKVKGTVVNCSKLNVREHPDTAAAVLCVISASDEVKVFADEKYDEWQHVITEAGIEGFCMKKYIAIKQ